jgi:hypothetical protein
MYTLRIIEETREDKNIPFEQVIENHELGSSYSKIKKGISSEFDQITKDLFPNEDTIDVESIICGENEKVFFILSKTETRNNAYFIMTDSGKTFEKL